MAQFSAGTGHSWTLKLLAFAVMGTSAWIAQTNRAERPILDEGEHAPSIPIRAIGAVNPRLGPDGKSVAFSYQGAIWRMPTEGGAMRRLAKGAGFAVEPCWSPDGRRIAFLQGRRFGSGRVHIIDAQSGNAVNLPFATVLGVGPLFFTPDGARLVGFLRTENQTESLRLLDLATGKLTSVQPLRSWRTPWALAPDGKSVALVTTRDRPEEQSGNNGPQVEIWRIPAESGESQLLARVPARVQDLCWSADGNALYVSTEMSGAHLDIWRIALADPERPVKMTFSQADEDQPSISADGRWLLYRDNHEGCPGLVLHDLHSGSDRRIAIHHLDFGVDTGRAHLRFVDKASGRQLIARVALEDQEGAFHAPPGAIWKVFNGVGYFYVCGQDELELPAGRYRVRAWHGPEYRRTDSELEIRPGATAEKTVFLDRWTDPSASKWYSGENHIHANYGYGDYYITPPYLAQMCAGEGLNVANFMVANSEGDGVFDREFFRGRPDPHSTAQNLLYWNEEFRSTIWGHMTLVNLRHVVEPVFMGFADTTNPYDIPTMSAIAELTHRQGGLVNYTHPASRIDDLYRGAYSAKGLPVYAALGMIDTMDVVGSGDAASGALYHRLLNCGFRLGASAGTDCFLNRLQSSLPGGERVYVKTDGAFTYTGWIAGLKTGHSFVTNGPMLELSVNGKQMGSTVTLAAPGELSVKASASSQFPLDRIELLFSGDVVASASPSRGALTTRLDQTYKVERSGWLAMRALGPVHSDVQGEALYAHTSPIYVTVGGKPAGSAEEARYFLKWIDRLWNDVEWRGRIPGVGHRSQVQSEIERARQVYRRLIDQG